MKLQAIAILTFLIFENVMAQETTTTKYINSTDMEALKLTQEWDKTFPQSDKVEHTKITFHNRYGITLAADLYKPKNTQGRLAAIAVSGTYGAVKEQVSVPLCPDTCRTRLSDHCFRSLLLRRKWWYTSLSYVTRNQYGGFQRGSRLSDIPCGRRSGTYRNLRYLRLGRVCT